MWHSQDTGPPAEQTFGQKVCYSRKSATIMDMSRAGSVMLGARIVVEHSSLVNETHLLTWVRERPFSIKLGSWKILIPITSLRPSPVMNG